MTRRVVASILTLAACTQERADELAPEAGEAETVLAWGFEPASGDCNGWPVLGAGAIRAAPPRSGAYSCKLCADGSAPSMELGHDVGPVPPGRYVLSAWVRKRARNEAPPAATARLDATLAGRRESATGTAVGVREAWDRVDVKLDLADRAARLRVTIGAPSSEPERCLFVDDVSLVRE